jgi:hypothetical protein
MSSRNIVLAESTNALHLGYKAPKGSRRDPIERFAYLLHALVELWYACYPDGYIASSLRDADDIQIPTGVKLIATWWIFFVLASLLAFALGFSLRRSTSNPVLTMNGSILFGCLYVLDTAVCALGSLIVIRILQSDFGISKSKKSNLVAYAYGSSGAAGKSAAP